MSTAVPSPIVKSCSQFPVGAARDGDADTGAPPEPDADADAPDDPDAPGGSSLFPSDRLSAHPTRPMASATIISDRFQPDLGIVTVIVFIVSTNEPIPGDVAR